VTPGSETAGHAGIAGLGGHAGAGGTHGAAGLNQNFGTIARQIGGTNIGGSNFTGQFANAGSLMSMFDFTSLERNSYRALKAPASYAPRAPPPCRTSALCGRGLSDSNVIAVATFSSQSGVFC